MDSLDDSAVSPQAEADKPGTVHRFVVGAIASTYDLGLSGFLDSAPRQATNASLTSLKIVRRF